MSSETRKRLASLTFPEKLKLLEKLRSRSLALAATRKKMDKKKSSKSSR
jgi:hypothetical protein